MTQDVDRDRIRNAATEPEVEITPEMIEAGLDYIYGVESWCSRPATMDEIRDTLSLVYRAMSAARPTSGF
jgi:hypothetical protein